MEAKSIKTQVYIPKINKKIVVYEYGTGEKKILLVHGWSGRGTQLVKIADELLKIGYSIISFDAPGHGKSSGKTTDMTEFIHSILELEKIFGPFEAAIGHSLGGMALLNSVKKQLNIKQLVIIGSGDKVESIINSFISRLELPNSIAIQMQKKMESKHQILMNQYDASYAAKEVSIPVLVIHDQNDSDIPVSASINIHQNLEKGALLITKELGHRKILGDDKVIKSIINFLNN